MFILDEIQSGMGRTGKIYCFEEEGLDPDMLLLGKALGNGIHVGAVLMKDAPEDFYRLALVGGAGDTEFTYTAGCAVFEDEAMPKLKENGLLVGAAEYNKIVLRPPYVITKENIDDMISVFEDLLK